MLDIVGSEDGKFDGTADTVVSTEGSTLCLQPFTVYIGLDGILMEVELYVYQFIANHIHVALEDDGISVLISRSCSLANENVSCFVNQSLELMAFAEFLQILNHVFLMLGRARYFVDFSELLKHESRF